MPEALLITHFILVSYLLYSVTLKMVTFSPETLVDFLYCVISLKIQLFINIVAFIVPWLMLFQDRTLLVCDTIWFRSWEHVECILRVEVYRF
jgi:hypothetical protein